MQQITNYITEKLKISKSDIDNKTIDYDYTHIDNMKPSSKERAEAALAEIEDRYGEMFDDIKITRANNVKLGKLIEQKGKYKDSVFTLYLNTDHNRGCYIIRRTVRGMFGESPYQMVKDFKTLAETFAKFDTLLKKNGYFD